jgi:uncharacterized DUF497 family protein
MAEAGFDWDPEKDRENQSKHGVSFAVAQFAFGDPRRVIAEDLSHSSSEKRYYCFGEVGGGILTVRFTYREGIFEYLVPVTGDGAKGFMTEKIKYTDEPLGTLKVVPDFLPSPEELAFREEGVKVTIALSKRSIEFFKREAAKYGTQYQRMIRRLLDTYARHHSRPLTTRSTRTRGKSSRAG